MFTLYCMPWRLSSVGSGMSPSTSSAWAQRWTIVLDSIEALTCSCNQHIICTACVLKEDIAKKLKEVKDD